MQIRMEWKYRKWLPIERGKHTWNSKDSLNVLGGLSSENVSVSCLVHPFHLPYELQRFVSIMRFNGSCLKWTGMHIPRMSGLLMICCLFSLRRSISLTISSRSVLLSLGSFSRFASNWAIILSSDLICTKLARFYQIGYFSMRPSWDAIFSTDLLEDCCTDTNLLCYFADRKMEVLRKLRETYILWWRHSNESTLLINNHGCHTSTYVAPSCTGTHKLT
jgi:hypothetical protein